MRSVLRSHDEVAHYWANKVQDSGRAGNMFFEDGKIYSYGRHFCIARHLDNGRILFTSRDYSISTSKHKWIVQRAIGRDRDLIYVPCPEETYRNREQMESEIKDQLEAAVKPRIRAGTRLAHYNKAQRLAESFNEFAEAIGDSFRMPIPQMPDEATMAQLRAKAREDEAKLAAKRALQSARWEEEARLAAIDRERSLAEKIPLWRRGEHTQLPWGVPTMLRVKDGAVQTSRGAEIPVEHAKRLWPLILRVRSEGYVFKQPADLGMRLGVYHLDSINPDGSIVVGCHDIGWDEIAYIATVLGLTEGHNVMES
jgi:hypothetical protein